MFIIRYIGIPFILFHLSIYDNRLDEEYNEIVEFIVEELRLETKFAYRENHEIRTYYPDLHYERTGENGIIILSRSDRIGESIGTAVNSYLENYSDWNYRTTNYFERGSISSSRNKNYLVESNYKILVDKEKDILGNTLFEVENIGFVTERDVVNIEDGAIEIWLKHYPEGYDFWFYYDEEEESWIELGVYIDEELKDNKDLRKYFGVGHGEL